jgi:hypothetical protein
MAILGGGTWLLAQQLQHVPSRDGKQPVVYSICKTNNGILMLDILDGRTWMLRRVEDGKLSWLPIQRINSEKEATQLWRNSSDYAVKTGKNGQPLLIDDVLKEQGYISFPLNKLKTGYLGIDIRIEEKNLFLAVDTAAPFTHLDLERVKHLRLKWQPYDKIEGKEKSLPTQASSWCEVSKLEIGTVEIRHVVVAGHDLSDINKNLVLYMEPQLDGVLGSDVLTKLDAVIDYSTIKIYIKPKEGKNQKGKEKKEKGAS